MEGKTIKEEIPEKDTTPNYVPERRSKGSKERCRSPVSPCGGSGGTACAERSPDGSPGSGGGQRTSPNHNGSAGSSSPGAGGGGEGVSPGRPPPARLKRFLSTLVQFANDISPDVGDRVRTLIHNLVSSSMSIEEFQVSLQEATNFPLRPFVLPFLRAALPPLQRELLSLARHAKQTPSQYVRSHEAVVFEPGSSEPPDMFIGTPSSPTNTKRSAADAFYDGSLPQTNGSHNFLDGVDYQPPNKRQLLVNPAPLLFPLQSHSHLFEYPHPYHMSFHAQSAAESSGFDLRRDSGVRDPPNLEPRSSSMTLGSAPITKNDEEWKNINTMLNCILSMVEKTKRALAILQQRNTSHENFPPEGSDIKRAAGEIMAMTVRQTEERVAEVRRRAEEAVNQVKRQAVADLQRAAAAERGRLERLLRPNNMPPGNRRANSQSPPPQDHHNSCWNCGRKAQETCSGCNMARYCGAFCQHKDWENHHQVCCGRDQKPPTTALLTVTSPPSTQPKGAQATRSSTPVSSSTPSDRLALTVDRLAENRLSLCNLNNAERLLSSSDRILSSSDRILSSTQDRITLGTGLANLGTSQGLISGVGGKK